MDFEALKPEIAEIGLKHKLEFVALFGSQARGKTHAKSDIDIAVKSGEKIDILKIMGDFYDLFKRDDVEVVDLEDASSEMMMVVLRDDKVLYEREIGLFDEWKIGAIVESMETRECFSNLYKEFLVEKFVAKES